MPLLRPLAALLAPCTLLATSMSCGGFPMPRPGRDQVQLDPPGAGTNKRPLPVGSLEVTDADIPCERGALDDSTCSRIRVSCPDIPDRLADLAIARPKGRAKGTVVAHRGLDGEIFFDAPGAMQRVLDAGFNVVQVRWEDDWQITPKGGILKAACRPATVFRHAYDEIHRGSKDTAFCAVGHSAGSGAIGYWLAHYGAGAVLDYAAFASGPPFARLDYGCAPNSYDGPKRKLCPALEDAPMALPGPLIDMWDNTWTCGDANPHPDDLARWKADSIISPHGDFQYPRTRVGFYNCALDPNGTQGGADLLASEITSDKDMVCFPDCRLEDLGVAGWKRITDDLIEQCVPRHGG